jgi:SAM-dependent methyltransferase
MSVSASDDGTRGDDPLERHRARTEETITSRDEAAIKGLYIELGRDFWDATRVHSDYAVPVLSAPETLTSVVGALEGITGVILDAGCGPNPAVALSLAADPLRVVVALDIGWGMVRTAQSVAERSGLRLLAVAADIERLPFRTGTFDALVCDDAIEHLPNDRTGVNELARVLRNGARALLATPNRRSAAVLSTRVRDRVRGIRRPGRDYYVASSHLREYTWPEFERLVGNSFIVERRIPVGWRSGRKRRLVTRLLHLPGLFHVSQMIVLQCKRGADADRR